MNTLIAFRCQDGSYVLAPHAASLPWFRNASVDFLGDVKTNSFGRAVALSIEKQLGDRNFAWVPQRHFQFGCSHALGRPKHTLSQAREQMGDSLRTSTRKRSRSRLLTAH